MRPLTQNEWLNVNGGGFTDLETVLGLGFGGLAMGLICGAASLSPAVNWGAAIAAPVIMMMGGAVGLGVGVAVGVTWVGGSMLWNYYA